MSIAVTVEHISISYLGGGDEEAPSSFNSASAFDDVPSRRENDGRVEVISRDVVGKDGSVGMSGVGKVGCISTSDGGCSESMVTDGKFPSTTPL